MTSPFERELRALLNRHSADAGADTPDFILAAYLVDCLASYARIKQWNDMWHSRRGVPAPMQESGPPLERNWHAARIREG
jgi:hypothetical protein